MAKTMQLIEIAACRICLDEKSRMFPITDKELIQIWENLTDIKFNLDTRKLMMACYICYAHLKTCAQLRKRALRSEVLLTELISSGVEVTQNIIGLIDRRKNNLRYNYNTSTTNTVDCISLRSIHTGEENIKFNVEFNSMAEDVLLKEEPVSNDNVHSFEEDTISYNLQEDLDKIEEKYSVPAEHHQSEDVPQVSTFSSEIFQCDDIKKELTVYNPEIQASETPFNRLIVPENIVYKDIITTHVRNQCETIVGNSFRKPVVLLNKLKMFQCKVCSKVSDCEICVKCRPKFKNQGSKFEYYISDEHRNIPFSDYDSFVTCDLNNDIQTHTPEKRFVCKFCGCSYSIEKSLNQHIVYKHMPKKFSCTFCPYQTVKESYLRVHVRKHTGEKPFSCDICNTRYSSNPNLIMHMKYKHMKRRFSCNICKNRFVKETELMVHMRRHTGEKPYGCYICDACYTSNYHLQEHIKHKHLQKKFSCDICQCQDLTEVDFVKHMQEHKAETPFNCGNCHSKFYCESSLHTHIKYKHRQEMKYLCDHCQYATKCKSHLIRHMRKHVGIKPYKCNICNTRYYWLTSLQVHLVCKHKQERKFSCDICKYQCTMKRDLKIHMREHTKEDLFTCDYCNTIYSDKSHLKKHMKYKHSQGTKFKCDICKYESTVKSNFTRHMRKHTGVKPYSCVFCDTKYSVKARMKEHMKFEHFLQKKFSCDICKYKCRKEEQLNIHMLKHTGEKPLSCDICNSKFYRKSTLLAHVKYKHTHEKKYSCDICEYVSKLKSNFIRHKQMHLRENNC